MSYKSILTRWLTVDAGGRGTEALLTRVVYVMSVDVMVGGCVDVWFCGACGGDGQHSYRLSDASPDTIWRGSLT